MVNPSETNIGLAQAADVELGPIKVSICMPCLNTASYLHPRLESILAQTHADFELIILDSGSEDGSWEIIQHYAQRDSRIHAVQQQRRGLYEDWNACVAMARYEWIYLATSDDTMIDEALAQFVAVVRSQREATVIGSRGWIIDSEGEDIAGMESRARAFSGVRYRRAGWCNPVEELMHGLIVGTPFFSITQLLIQRSVFDRVGFFPIQCLSSGDFRWQIKVVLSERVYFVANRLGSWRKHDTQHTRLRKNSRELVIREVLDELVSKNLGYKIRLAMGIAAGIDAPEYIAKLDGFSAWCARRLDRTRFWFRPRWRLVLALGFSLLPGGKSME
jgi:glycosyltransferase involved in cell wall biosynthesis